METVDKAIFEISIAGKNVTADLTPFLSRISYTDKEEAESDDVGLTFTNTGGDWLGDWYPETGDSLQVVIKASAGTLDCGQFEIDETEVEGPPDMAIVKGIAAAITKSLRTKNSKGFEKQSLNGIAKYFADKHSLKLVGDTSALQKIEIERKTQDNQTDISFLASLAKEYGFIFSVRGDQLVFMSVDELEARPSVMTIDKSDMSKWRFLDKTAQTYAGASVATRDIKSNTVKKWDIKPSGTAGEKDIIVVGGRVENETQAQAKAKGAMKDKNKDKITGTFSVAGNIALVAGINIDITGFGKFSGKWHVVSTGHSAEKSGGYLTDATVRKIIEKNA